MSPRSPAEETLPSWPPSQLWGIPVGQPVPLLGWWGVPGNLSGLSPCGDRPARVCAGHQGSFCMLCVMQNHIVQAFANSGNAIKPVSFIRDLKSKSRFICSGRWGG